MKIVVIGGTGLIGSKLVATLTEHGHEAIAASPNTGVDTLTGEGLADALNGADVVVDVSNSPSFDDDAVLEFFTTSTTNLLAAEKVAGIRHHVALSVVGTDRLSESGYFRAKIAQEALIKDGGVPYSIVHATQFFEFVRSIAAASTVDGDAHLSPALIQPIVSDDVATAVGRIAVGDALNATIEIAGPDQYGLDELVRIGLPAYGIEQKVVTDGGARYFGALLGTRTLLPGEGAEIFETRFEDFLKLQSPRRPDPQYSDG